MNNTIADFIEKCKSVIDVTKEKGPHLLSDIFNKSGNENFMSDWLSFILNPEVNSIGMKPLQALIIF